MSLLKRQPTILADDATENVGFLLKLRLPWLFLGLLGGGVMTFAISRFEQVLNENIKLAFFIPLIVYMSDAIGTQTETIFVRNIGRKKVSYLVYFAKELALGIILGFIFGLAVWLFSLLWFQDWEIALTVGLAMLASCATASVIALLLPIILYREH